MSLSESDLPDCRLALRTERKIVVNTFKRVMHIGGKSVLPFGQFLNGDVHIGGNFIVMRRPVQLAGEFFLTRREAFAHLNCCAAQIELLRKWSTMAPRMRKLA